MKGNKQVLVILNEILTFELNCAAYKKSIKDMKQADQIIERILFLEGLPNLQMLGKLMIGEETAEMLDCDMAFQNSQIPLLKRAISLCEDLQDFVSRDLIVSVLSYEEDHIDWIETQQYQITHLGLENYLQSQVEED
jgi:bacterioferritin